MITRSQQYDDKYTEPQVTNSFASREEEDRFLIQQGREEMRREVEVMLGNMILEGKRKEQEPQEPFCYPQYVCGYMDALLELEILLTDTAASSPATTTAGTSGPPSGSSR